MDDCNQGDQPSRGIRTDTRIYTRLFNGPESADGSCIGDDAEIGYGPVMQAAHSEVSSLDWDWKEYYLAIGLDFIGTFSSLSYFGYLFLSVTTICHDSAAKNKNDLSNSNQTATGTDHDIDCSWAFVAVAMGVFPVVAMVLQEYILIALFKLLLPLCLNSLCHLDVGKTTSSGPSNSSDCCDKDSFKTRPYSPKKSLFARLFPMPPTVYRYGKKLTAAEIIERYKEDTTAKTKFTYIY